MARHVEDAERREPCDHRQQADIGGQLGRRVPACPRADCDHQDGRGRVGQEAGGQANRARSRLSQRRGAGARENPRLAARGFELRQLEVIACAGHPVDLRVEEQLIQIPERHGPAGPHGSPVGRAQHDRRACRQYPLASEAHRAEQPALRALTGVCDRPFFRNALHGHRVGILRAQHCVVGRHPECVTVRRHGLRPRPGVFASNRACGSRCLSLRDCSEGLQLRFNRAGGAGGHHLRRLMCLRCVVLHAQHNEPRSSDQQHRQHQAGSQPAGASFGENGAHLDCLNARRCTVQFKLSVTRLVPPTS